MLRACGFIGIFGALFQAVLVVLKLCGVVDWFWFVVLMPVEAVGLYLLAYAWEVWRA